MSQESDDRQDARQDARANARDVNNGDAIASGIQKGVKDSRLHMTDNRMLVLYIVMVAFVLASTLWQHTQTADLRRTQHANFALCLSIEQGHVNFNKLLDQAARNIQANTAYTPAQKAEATKFYQAAHLPILVCKGLAP